MAAKKKKAKKKKTATKKRRPLELRITKGIETADGAGYIWGGTMVSDKGGKLPIGTVVCKTKTEAKKRLARIFRERLKRIA